MSFLHWAKTVFLRPKHFFEHEAQHITGWKHPLQYMGIFILITTIFLAIEHISKNNISIFNIIAEWIFTKLGMQYDLPQTHLSNSNFIIVYLVLVMYMFTSSILRYWITHWYVLIWNHKAHFQDTTKALSFSTTPGWLGMPFLVFSSFFLFIALNTQQTWSWIGFGICTATFIGLEIYSVYVRTIGLSHIQSISKTKAFLSIYILGVPTFLIISTIIQAIILGLMFLTLALTNAFF